MHGFAALAVVLHPQAVAVALRRPVPALPLELGRRDEVVGVLELLLLPSLFEADEQELVPAERDVPLFQCASENSRPNSGGISSRE